MELLKEIGALLDSDGSFTDVHIEQGCPVKIKTPSGWKEIDIAPVSYDDLACVFELISQDWQVEIAKGAINRPLMVGSWRLRANAFMAQSGVSHALSLRRWQKDVPVFKDTGLPAMVRRFTEMRNGLVLVCGATSSGKSTTIASLVNEINATKNAHIITIEDPIEYVHHYKNSIVTQREVGVDVPSFLDGVRDAMRQTPDVIVVGEIRDEATADACLLAADSGHLVIASLHANTAVSATQKILGFFQNGIREARAETLAHVLVGIVCQVLLPSADKTCRVLASEVLSNYRGTFSRAIGDRDKLQSAFENCPDAGAKVALIDSMVDLAKKRLVTVQDLYAAGVVNQEVLRDRLKREGI